MTQILGTLLDSGGSPVTGKLRVTLTGNLIDIAANPDSIQLVEPSLFDITNGVLNITLNESETKKVTYRFEFFKTDAEGNLIEPALLDFYAIVPNLADVQFASLAPTGMVNDVLDTGALRVAQIIANNPNLAQSIGGPFPQGNFNPASTYKYRDLVNYLNRTYISKSITPITGVLPTDTNNWMLIPVEPDGNLILGDDTPYGVAWDGSGLAASQDAIYDAIQTVNSNINLKANIDSPIFTGNVIVPNQTAGSNNNRAANTSYVDEGLALKADTTYVDAGLNLKANLASPNLTGNPIAPTPSWGSSNTSIATTQYVTQAFTPKLIVGKGTTQTIPNNVATAVTNYASPTLDTNSIFNASTGVAVIPVGRSGTYIINGLVGCIVDGSSTGYGRVSLYLGVSGLGDVLLDEKQLTNFDETGMYATGSVMLNLVAGQQLNLWVSAYHDTPPTSHYITVARFELQRIP
ncbi:hypothetical protein Nos7524_3221 [Nostoc sp. PCC 7524]|uniref:hypothetical protein n=1 Tax=Nostoc sp. (strain ATCC 29411 / PCC 7524) TaxID=28072 RepID=UPI00029EE929|nr:hypothetical protein [Nostoc sp. PCC 7524]AFY49021.1 hypothetical protein Nos7524_3221 [Nostoc sp. PCC 7524]